MTARVRPHPSPQAIVFADCFNRYFEPQNLRSGLRVLQAAGVPVQVAGTQGERPLCCGRTFLSVGLVDEARAEARRLITALVPLAEQGVPIIGLEPSCLLTLRDEIPALLPGPEADLLASQAMMLEEYIAGRADDPAFDLRLKSPAPNVLLHGIATRRHWA